jgi:hypothetical protein
MGSLLHFSPLPHAHMAQVHESLRRVVTGRAPGHVKAAALRLLAPTGDAAAGQQLIAFLQDPSTAPLSLPQTISLLRFFPNHYEAIRQQIMSPRDEVAISAIHALYNDAKSAAQRRQLAADRSRSVSVRKAAIQSLMHDDSVDGVAVLLGIFGDAADDLDVRAEAVAAAKVYFQRKSKGISAADKAAWLQKIQAVPTGVVDRSELAALKEQALNALTAK